MASGSLINLSNHLAIAFCIKPSLLLQLKLHNYYLNVDLYQCIFSFRWLLCFVKLLTDMTISARDFIVSLLTKGHLMIFRMSNASLQGSYLQRPENKTSEKLA